ncbi:hypothetical protein AVT14_gp39 [Mycobacterium phage Abrogate]|uniref:hypothetical protein n=1 Tax=Mycobacterium phage Abrogate TaxID=1551710 RepID=UPI00051A8F26|nr:hypothetical protein AVT14_gp39 [Mycobacterium phage Abrogate]AIT13183.1 hypothetical protein PBI_ABROGATE_390 [Mycobacterium phage Abrogate]
MSKKKKDITVEQLAMITDRLTEAVDLLKIISTQTRPGKPMNPTISVNESPSAGTIRIGDRTLPYNAPVEAVWEAVRELDQLKEISTDEKERYHAYRDKPLQPYVRVHEDP